MLFLKKLFAKEAQDRECNDLQKSSEHFAIKQVYGANNTRLYFRRYSGKVHDKIILSICLKTSAEIYKLYSNST